MEGKLRREYIEENGILDASGVHPTRPANFNMRGREAERPVFVEVIDQNGQPVLAQNAGLRVVGGYPRGLWENKSLRIYARKVYEPQMEGSFNYDFFQGKASRDGVPITKFKRLTLRGVENASSVALPRDVVAHDMVDALLDTQKARPAAVFLNGEYYSYVWIREVTMMSI